MGTNSTPLENVDIAFTSTLTAKSNAHAQFLKSESIYGTMIQIVKKKLKRPYFEYPKVLSHL